MGRLLRSPTAFTQISPHHYSSRVHQEVEIRALSATDVPAVLRIQETAYAANFLEGADSFVSKIAASSTTSFGAWHNGEMVGYLIAFPVDGHAGVALNSSVASPVSLHDATAMYIHDLAVHPNWRGRAVADHLLEELTLVSAHHSITAYALVSVQGSRGFWEKRGFVVSTDPVPNGYGPEAVLMLRR